MLQVPLSCDPASDPVSPDRTSDVALWSQNVLRNVEGASARQVTHDRRTAAWFSLQLCRAGNRDTQVLQFTGRTKIGQALYRLFRMRCVTCAHCEVP